MLLTFTLPLAAFLCQQAVFVYSVCDFHTLEYSCECFHTHSYMCAMLRYQDDFKVCIGLS